MGSYRFWNTCLPRSVELLLYQFREVMGCLLYTSSLVSGAYIVETIFGWPGLGTTGMSAIYSRDYNMIMGTTMLSCLLLVGGNLLADLCYCLADPRIKAMRGRCV